MGNFHINIGSSYYFPVRAWIIQSVVSHYAIDDLKLNLIDLVNLNAARWPSNQNAPLSIFCFKIHKQTQMLSKNGVSVLIAKLIASVPKLTMSSACLFGRRKKYDVRYALRFVFVMFNIRHFRLLFWSECPWLLMMMMMPYHHAKPKPPPFSLLSARGEEELLKGGYA